MVQVHVVLVHVTGVTMAVAMTVVVLVEGGGNCIERSLGADGGNGDAQTRQTIDTVLEI